MENLRQQIYRQQQILLMEAILLVRIDKIPLVPDTNEPNIMKPLKKYIFFIKILSKTTGKMFISLFNRTTKLKLYTQL